MVAKLPLEAVLRCTTKLVSLLVVSVQLRRILLDEVDVAPNPVGADGTVTGGGSVIAKASFENPESPAPLVA